MLILRKYNLKTFYMRTHLRLFYTLLFFGLLCGTVSYAQIDYSESFDTPDHDWELVTLDSGDSDISPCEGDSSLWMNLYDFLGFGTEGEFISPVIGESNGGQATLTFQYKLLDYDSPPTEPTSSTDWGSIEIAYSTSPTGPFTVIETINPANHVSSVNCVTKTINFFPPLGEDVYIRVYGQIGAATNDFYFFFDEVAITQTAPVSCSGTPAASTAISTSVMVCNTQDFTLSLNPPITDVGLTYQWQSSTDGVTFQNIIPATGQQYTTTTSAEMWYRAIVTCTDSGLTSTSTPVHVDAYGACYCEVEFADAVEPITLVNFAGINNSSSATVGGSPSVEYFTSLPPAQVTAGQTYPIILKGNTAGDWIDYFKVYIDFDRDGNLEESESFLVGTIESSSGNDAVQATGSITIPATALPGVTYMRVHKLFDVYTDNACTAVNEFEESYGQAEDYLVNITAPCDTQAPIAPEEQTFCSNPDEMTTLENLEVTAEGEVVWYADEAGGEPLAEDTALADGETYFAAQIMDECESEDRAEVTVSLINVTVDVLQDIIACEEYVLPVLINGDYYTEADGGGDMLESGAAITENATIYIYAAEGECSAQSSFTVAIGAPQVTDPDDVVTCEEYELPALESGAYYTEPAGEGDELEAGTIIEESMTIYVFAGSGDCTAEESFEVTINETDDLLGNNVQELQTGATVGDLVVVGEDGAIIVWYASLDDAEDGINPLTVDTVLEDDTFYYATQSVNDCASDPFEVLVNLTLGVENFNLSSLSYYPNPVINEVNLSYSAPITTIEVYNLLGQNVMTAAFNHTSAKLDMSGLTAGSYLMKVSTQDGSATIKILKQ